MDETLGVLDSECEGCDSLGARGQTAVASLRDLPPVTHISSLHDFVQSSALNRGCPCDSLFASKKQ